MYWVSVVDFRHQSLELITCILCFFFSFRFNDIHVPVRLECVKFASHCLMNHPDLARDLTGVFSAPKCVSISFVCSV